MFMSDVLAKVSAPRELFISQTLRQISSIDNQCAKSKSKQTCFLSVFRPRCGTGEAATWHRVGRARLAFNITSPPKAQS